MNWFDLIIIGIILVSTLIGLVRGFVKESVSLASWILAGFIAFRYFSVLSELLLPYLDSPTLRIVIAFAALFLVTLIVGAIVNYLLSEMVSKTKLSGTDKTLGMVFGMVRGALIIVMIILLADFTPMPNESWWQISITVGYFVEMADWIKSMLPEDIVSRFSV